MRKKKKAAGRVWDHRVVGLFGFICLLFALLIIRIAVLTTGTLTETAAEQDTGRVLLGETRGYIYDRNRVPLVNAESSLTGVVLCCADTLDTVNSLFGGAALRSIRAGSLLTKNIKEELPESKYVKNFRTVRRVSENSLCRHIIGYTDGAGNGVCGIEKAFDRVLSEASGKAYAEMTVDASGRALTGDGVRITGENYDSPAGVSLTVDSRIQRIAEQALAESDITCGAAVVQDCRTGELLACASVPVYDPLAPGKSLHDENLPFLDRAVSAYPVGSVFKPFIAAAALRSGVSLNDVFTCAGTITAGAQEFRCFNGNVHGSETLGGAIANSCNTYFIDLGLKVGSEELMDTCALFGFGKCVELFPGDGSDGGNLPEAEEITSAAQLANICFGQGELLVTPVQLAAAYSVLANGGIYREPYILSELIDGDGKAYGYFRPETEEYRVLPEEDCKFIGRCLYNNMIEGTGAGGRPANTTAAGKTATAQTGRYDENGVEQLCTWFAGYFPYTQPRYTVVVFNEKGRSAAADCAPVFKNIAEKIAALK